MESFKYLVSLTSDPSAMVKSVCKTNILTEEFLQEYSSYIDKTDFILSYKLSASLAKAHPDLFDEELLINAVKEFIKTLNDDSAEEDKLLLNSLFSVCIPVKNESKNTKKENSITKDPADLSLSMYAKYIDKLDEIIGDTKEDVVSKIIRAASKEELSDSDTALLFIGRYTTAIDNLLLKRITDPNVRDTIILMLSTRDGSDMTQEAYKYISAESKEELLNRSCIDPEVFINTLSESTDLGWINTTLQKVKNNETTLSISNKQLDSQLLKLVSIVSEDMCSDIFKIGSTYFPNAFSYKLMAWLLNNKAFDEEHLIAGKDLFIKAGLKLNLKNIAKQNDYKELLSIL